MPPAQAGRARPSRDVAPRRATVAAIAGCPKRRDRLLGDQTPSGRGQGPRVQGASREVPGLGLFRCSGRKRGGVRCGGRARRPHLRTGGSRTAATSTVTPPDVLGRCGRSRCWRRRCMPAPSAGLTSQIREYMTAARSPPSVMTCSTERDTCHFLLGRLMARRQKGRAGEPCGVPEVVPGSLTSGDPWLGMIAACRCACCT
jgi:hypothetical protein